MNVDSFFLKTRIEKKKFIISQSEKITDPKNLDQKLFNAYKYKEVLNQFIVEYINKKNKNKKEIEKEITNKIDQFKNRFINITLEKKIKETPTNLYQMSGATDFAKINLILRSLSTSMGHLWENIATSSNLAISTETEFDIKINGVDIIFIKDKKPYYAQIKTLEGTLTGSQVPRSISELSIHKNSYFVSAFKTGTPWTFNSDKIEKLLGKEFWVMLDLDYDFILNNVKKMIKTIEDSYYKKKKIL